MGSNITDLMISSKKELVNPPVKPGDIVELAITDLNHEGEGVARVGGFAIFIPGALPGELARVKVETVKKNYGRGLALDILSPSPDRLSPACGVFQRCGGCQLQHLSYTRQLEFKRERVVEALERIGRLAGIKVEPTIGMEEPWRYRNKAQYPVGLRQGGPGKGGLIGGFFEKGTHVIVPCENCLIHHPLAGRVLNETLRLAETFGIDAYDEKTGSGFLRHVLVKIGFATGETMVVLVVNGRSFPRGREFGEALHQAVPQIQSVIQNINQERTNVILGSHSRVLWGKDHIIDMLGHFRFRISAESFYQVNPAQTETLYRKAVEFAGLSGREVVADLYCGIGTITLLLAEEAREVYGIEVVPAAISDARANARMNQITNARFMEGDTAAVLSRLMRDQGIRFDVVVMDPPKSGCEGRVLDLLIAARVERIVYVSCNPASLARDLARLAGGGYSVEHVQPVDMFPQTYHVETVALLRVGDNAARR